MIEENNEPLPAASGDPAVLADTVAVTYATEDEARCDAWLMREEYYSDDVPRVRRESARAVFLAGMRMERERCARIADRNTLDDEMCAENAGNVDFMDGYRTSARGIAMDIRSGE